MQKRISKFFRWTYAVSAALFFVGVLVQVFLAGLVVVSRLGGWSNHRDLGHGLGIFLLIMILAMFPARLPGRMRWLTGLLFVVYVVQADVVIFMRESVPYAAALHPVLALFDFLLGQHLLRESIRQVRGKSVETPADGDAPGERIEPRIGVRET